MDEQQAVLLCALVYSLNLPSTWINRATRHGRLQKGDGDIDGDDDDYYYDYGEDYDEDCDHNYDHDYNYFDLSLL